MISLTHRSKVVAAAVCVVIAAAVGVVPHLLGYGWFGYRIAAFGHTHLYAMNLGEEPRDVSVDGAPPRRVEPEAARLLPIVGGRSVVEVTSEQTPPKKLEIDSGGHPVFLPIDSDTCFAVSSFESLPADEDGVQLIDVLDADTTVYNLPSSAVLWPNANPQMLEGDGAAPFVSLEVIDCWLEDDEPFLAEYLASQLNDRL